MLILLKEREQRKKKNFQTHYLRENYRTNKNRNWTVELALSQTTLHTCTTSLSAVSTFTPTALWARLLGLLRQPCWICWLSSSMAAGLSVMTLTDSWKLTLFRARSLGTVSLTSSAARHDFCVNKQTKDTRFRDAAWRGCTLPHDQDKVCSMWKLEENLSDSLNTHTHTHTHTPNTDTKPVCLHCSSTVNSSSAAAGVCADWFPTLGGTRCNAAALWQTRKITVLFIQYTEQC